MRSQGGIPGFFLLASGGVREFVGELSFRAEGEKSCLRKDLTSQISLFAPIRPK